MPPTKFADLPIVDAPWNPNGIPDSELKAAILGDPPDWARYEEAHLWADPEKADTLEGYKLKIARMRDGVLTVFFPQLASRVGIIMGAREGVEIPEADKVAALRHAERYYTKIGKPFPEDAAALIAAQKDESDDDEEDMDDDDEEKKPAEPGALFAQLVRCAPIRLDPTAAEGDDNAPKWIQVAEAGTFKGHALGPFELDRAAFEEVVANFRANPSFQAGANGVGEADVIAFDFSHASEERPANIAVQGAPAQAWALDLAIRDGDDGKAQLWALTRFLEPARTYVKEDRYKWTSVAIWPDAKDPKTGKKIGWYLSSIALTNDPFIQGMVPIAAARQLRFDKPEEWVREIAFAVGIRGDAMKPIDPIDVRAELDKLAAMVADPATVPKGVDPFGLVDSLRWVVNLPLTTPAEAILEEARKALDLAEGNAPAPSPETGTPTAAQRKADMDLLKLIATRFGIPADEAAVQKKILAELEAGQTASDGLRSLLSLLGVEDVEGGATRIADLLKNAKTLEEIFPQLAELAKAQVGSEEQSAEADVAAAMTAHGLPDTAKAALVFMRTGNIVFGEKDTATEIQAKLAQRQSAATDFAAKYPVPDASQAHLQAPLATPAPQPHSPILRGLSAGYRGVQANPLVPDLPPAAPGGPTEAEIDAMPGRNVTEKAMALVRKNAPDPAALTFEACHEQASILLAQTRRAS